MILNESSVVAEVLSVEPVIRFCAVISNDDQVRQAAIETLSQVWGRVRVRSEVLPFEAGGYYAAAMGENLKKQWVAFGDPADPAGLADWKHHSNRIEADFAAERWPQSRPLNLDPGYITQAKLVLATTKDRDHRLYLRDGMFAEITLTYTAKRWVHHRWTYPDYRGEATARFATACRNLLRDHLRSQSGFRQR